MSQSYALRLCAVDAEFANGRFPLVLARKRDPLLRPLANYASSDDHHGYALASPEAGVAQRVF